MAGGAAEPRLQATHRDRCTDSRAKMSPRGVDSLASSLAALLYLCFRQRRSWRLCSCKLLEIMQGAGYLAPSYRSWLSCTSTGASWST